MKKYDIIFEALQLQVEDGSLTVEDAEVLNDLAYEKYVDDDTDYEIEESFEEDEGMTAEEYLESMEDELFSEGGGARKRYLEKLADKQNKYKKDMDLSKKKKQISSQMDKSKFDDEVKTSREEYDKLAAKASRYSARVGQEIGIISNDDVGYARDGKRIGYKCDGKEPDEIDKSRELKKVLKDKFTMHGGYSNDLGGNNQYGTGPYRQDISSYDGAAKKRFKNDTSGPSAEKNINVKHPAKYGLKYGAGDRGKKTIPEKLKKINDDKRS